MSHTEISWEVNWLSCISIGSELDGSVIVVLHSLANDSQLAWFILQRC